jgi:glycosyltransferase involved in cell wall biosynthesis
LICWIKILWQIFNINLKSKINFFFSFWLVETALIGELASYIFRKKHFVYLFGQDVLPQNPYLPKINLKKPFIIANSDFTAKTFFESTGRNPEAIVPLGLHLKNIPAINPAEIKAFDIMGAGSLSEIKNYSLFIEIISELKKSFPQIKCCLAGDGDEESRLKEKIKKLNLENVIELKGELKREELISLLQQSKIFLHTSSFESFCMARLEALTCGCSVITFDNGYIPQSEKFIVCKTKEEMMEKILFVLNTTNLTDRAEIRTAQQIVIELNKILLTV